MIEHYFKNKGEMKLVCEVCGQSDFFYGTWGKCIFNARQSGWQLKRTDAGKWLHFCSVGCQWEVEHEKCVTNSNNN